MIETERLLLRELTQADLPAVCDTLQNDEVRRVYEHDFTGEEAAAWIDRQRARYERYGFGLWAVILKENRELIGQCGITMQEWEGRRVPEIGYLFAKHYWHRGYATEAAAACREYAFRELGLPEVYSIIRENNLPSQKVARRNGMTVVGRQIKHYYGMEMPHLVFSVRAGTAGRQA